MSILAPRYPDFAGHRIQWRRSLKCSATSMTTMSKVTISDALLSLARHHQSYVRLLERSDFDVGMYTPKRVADQTPHERDELNIIARGAGEFVCDGGTIPFE